MNAFGSFPLVQVTPVALAAVSTTKTDNPNPRNLQIRMVGKAACLRRRRALPSSLLNDVDNERNLNPKINRILLLKRVVSISDLVLHIGATQTHCWNRVGVSESCSRKHAAAARIPSDEYHDGF